MENGRYAAHPMGKGTVHVGDHENGCLICNMDFAFDAGGTITHTFWMSRKNNGGINEDTTSRMKQLFGWDGVDFYWFEDHAEELAAIAVELTVENETFLKKDGTEGNALRVKYVDLVGGGGGGQKIANADRKTLMAKYGAKFRAVAGGTPAAKKTAPSAPAPAQAPTPPAPKKTVFPSDMNACWKEMLDSVYKHPKEGESKDEQRARAESTWLRIIPEVHGTKDQTEYTPQDWGAVMAAIKHEFDNLPF